MIKQCVLDYSNTILPYASLKRGQVPLLSASEEPCLFFVLVLTTFLPQKVYVLCPPPRSRTLLGIWNHPFRSCFRAWCLQMAGIHMPVRTVWMHKSLFSSDTIGLSLGTACSLIVGNAVTAVKEKRTQKFLLPSSQTTAYFSFCSLAFSRGKPTHSPWYIGKKTVKSLFANIKQLHQPPMETICLSQSLLLHPTSVSHSGIR